MKKWAGVVCTYMYYHVEGVVLLEYQTQVREREPCLNPISPISKLG